MTGRIHQALSNETMLPGAWDYLRQQIVNIYINVSFILNTCERIYIFMFIIVQNI